MLNQHESYDGPDSDLLRLEYRREAFRRAAGQVGKGFQQATWDALWLTAVEAVTEEFKKYRRQASVGAAY